MRGRRRNWSEIGEDEDALSLLRHPRGGSTCRRYLRLGFSNQGTRLL